MAVVVVVAVCLFVVVDGVDDDDGAVVEWLGLVQLRSCRRGRRG